MCTRLVDAELEVYIEDGAIMSIFLKKISVRAPSSIWTSTSRFHYACSDEKLYAQRRERVAFLVILFMLFISSSQLKAGYR